MDIFPIGSKNASSATVGRGFPSIAVGSEFLAVSNRLVGQVLAGFLVLELITADPVGAVDDVGHGCVDEGCLGVGTLELLDHDGEGSEGRGGEEGGGEDDA